MRAAAVAKVIARHIGERTQAQLAEEAGLSVNTLSRIMSRPDKRVYMATVHKLARALGIPYSVFEDAVSIHAPRAGSDVGC